jgi:hypothetical protein
VTVTDVGSAGADAGARKAFVKALPEVVRWGPRNEDCHFGLAVLSASIDHVVPFERGGTSDLDNLVTACNPCQYGRGHFLLDELELEDPRAYAPPGDSWDGLTRLLPHETASLELPPGCTVRTGRRLLYRRTKSARDGTDLARRA